MRKYNIIWIYISLFFILLANPSSPLAAEGALEDALLKGNWQGVIEILEKDDSKAEDPVARLIMGHAFLATNKNNESMLLFLSAIEEDDLKLWQKWTDSLLDRHPQNPIALYLSAEEKEEKYDPSLFFKPQFFFAKQGVYIGFNIPYNNISGDFDGETIEISPLGDEIDLVPKVEGGLGWRISLGSRGPNSARELSYLRSYHDVTFLGAKGKASLNIVSLDFKYYLISNKPVQPYLLLGWNPATWLTVKDASASESEVGDATFTAISQVKNINLGGGLAYYLDPNISLNVGIIYRLISFERVEGVVFGPLEDPLDGSGLNFNIGIELTF